MGDRVRRPERRPALGDGRQPHRSAPTPGRARGYTAERAARANEEAFAEAAEEWFAARQAGKRPLRPRTAELYRSGIDLVLLPRFGRWSLADIDADAIASLTRGLEREGLHAIDPGRRVRPLGSSSIENYLKPLHGIFRYGVRRRWIGSNPFAVLIDEDRPMQVERARPYEWTTDELDALVSASKRIAERTGRGRRGGKSRYDYSPLLSLAATLGLRLSEVLGLRWEDLDNDADVLRVRRQWLPRGEYGPPKTKRGDRDIPLTAALLRDLRALRLRSKFSLDEHPIFSSRTGTPLGHRNVTRRGFEPAREEAGLPSLLTFHDLRHAVASRLIAAGLEETIVADVLGHDVTTLRTTYAHVFDRQRKAGAVRAAIAGNAGGAVRAALGSDPSG